LLLWGQESSASCSSFQHARNVFITTSRSEVAFFPGAPRDTIPRVETLAQQGLITVAGNREWERIKRKGREVINSAGRDG